MTRLLTNALHHEVFHGRPPILLDIGASGEIYPAWKEIMPFAHCITFEGDDRETETLLQNKSSWKKFTSFSSLATSEPDGVLDLHLTKFLSVQAH